VTTGSAVITYSTGAGCIATITVNVGNMPAITGNTNVCPGGLTQLSDAVPGGNWSSGSPTIASVNGTGLVYGGASAGNAVITYAANGCSTTATITVGAIPAITGGSTVCAGSTITLSDASTGGTWSSSNTNFATVTSSTGVVSGVAAGSATITYTVGGCTTTIAITVGNAISAISGTNRFCVTSNTVLSDATPGGAWSSSTVSVATIASGGFTVNAVAAGSATISYTVGGCSATLPITVDPTNAGTISGKDSICKGTGHVITLSDNISGGTWSSATPTKATVAPVTGVVTAIVNGTATATINYVVTNTCGTFTATYVVHIRTASQCATGVSPMAEPEIAGLKVFPNPNNGTFMMSLSSDIDEEVHVVVTNIVGAQVSEFTTRTNNQTDIRLSPAAGIYLLSASTSQGRYVAKVVVQR
jgi:uncharacterized protein YjdB